MILPRYLLAPLLSILTLPQLAFGQLLQPYQPYQPQPQPATPATRPILIVLTPDQPTTQSQQLLAWLTSGPNMSRLAANCTVHYFTPSNKLYQERYATSMPPHEAPSIALTDQGRVYYKASGPRIPASEIGLYEEMKSWFQGIREGYPSAEQVITQQPWQDCPDGRCPLQPQPYQPNPYQPNPNPYQPNPNRPPNIDVNPYDGSMPSVIPDSATLQGGSSVGGWIVTGLVAFIVLGLIAIVVIGGGVAAYFVFRK